MGEDQGRRTRSDAQRNLERVLRAAHELYAERGADVTMEEVARRAGVGVGTIYRRFASKEELFVAVSHAASAGACDALRSACRAGEPLERLRALVLTRCHAWGAEAGVPGEPDDLRALLHRLLAEAIADGQVAGVLRPGDPQLLAGLCLELLSPRALHRLASVAGADTPELAEETLRFVLHGLAAERCG